MRDDDDSRLDDTGRRVRQGPARLPHPAGRRDRRRRPRREHGPRLRRRGKALAAQDGLAPAREAPDPGRQDARVDRGRSERSALGDRVPPRGPRTGRRARSSTARTWSPHSAQHWTASSNSAPPSQATRRWSTRSVPAIDALSAALDAGEPLDRALAAATPGRRGGSEGNGAAPGPEGPRLLSRRALDRPPGPGRHISRAHHGRAPAGGQRDELMSERVLRGAPASPGLAAGHARMLSPPSGASAREPVPDAELEAEAERARARARGLRRRSSSGIAAGLREQRPTRRRRSSRRAR